MFKLNYITFSLATLNTTKKRTKTILKNFGRFTKLYYSSLYYYFFIIIIFFNNDGSNIDQ